MRLGFLLLMLGCFAVNAKDHRGAQFIGFTNWSRFEVNRSPEKTVLTSPKIEAAIQWDELVASWNYRLGPGHPFELEARVIYPHRATKWFQLGKWSLDDTNGFPRESVRGQKDDDGNVLTDILKLKEKARSFQVRVTLHGEGQLSGLDFVGFALCDSTAEHAALPPNKAAWGKTLDVPQQSQMAFEGGGEWCSPTAITMMLDYWANKLSRPELHHTVPDAARAIHDPNWPGTGNWSFNMAFAGSHDAIRAYATRFSDLSELEDWIAAGVPVAVSVRYGILKGAERPGNGHLIVCVGFDENGDIIVNDPGRTQVRQAYSRANLLKAWADSENTVYLIHPENWRLPQDRFGHWAPSPL